VFAVRRLKELLATIAIGLAVVLLVCGLAVIFVLYLAFVTILSVALLVYSLIFGGKVSIGWGSASKNQSLPKEGAK
jgi:hypothetical protein